MTEFLNGRVLVFIGDITAYECDAIVNAANSSLLGGGGVDGAIHRKGGPEILETCKKIRKDMYPDGLPTGMAVVTTAGKLPAQHVIHTVGPVWRGGGFDEDILLADCYTNSLRAAVNAGDSSIAFPAVSTGIYGFPKKRAAALVSAAVQAFLDSNETIERVTFVFFSRTDADIFIENQVFRN